MSDNMATAEPGRPEAPGNSDNLKWRIISGTVMALVAFALTCAGPSFFALLVLVVALFITWEWGRMVRGTATDLAFFVHATAVTGAILLAAIGYAALSIAVLVTGAIILIPLVFGRGARLSALGVFYVGLPAVALLWLRLDQHAGLAAVLFIFAIVWTSDIAAFASGRLIGGPRLWPRVSPKKTWAGLAGALSASLVVSLIAALILGDAPMARLVLVGLGLSLVAQIGDLAESGLKRAFGLKDASDLIPGHGGFMDRMDSIVAAAVAAALFALAVGPHAPARALLFGS